MALLAVQLLVAVESIQGAHNPRKLLRVAPEDPRTGARHPSSSRFSLIKYQPLNLVLFVAEQARHLSTAPSSAPLKWGSCNRSAS
jgi:hypothetical protein